MSEGSRIAPGRRAAFEVLRRVFEHGAWADRALPAAADRYRLDARDRRLARRLAYGSVQRRGTSDHLIAALAGRAATDLDPELAAALRLGLYELMFMDAVPDHAAVDQAVELAKAATGRAGGERLVNAVLRRAARERDQLLGGLDDSEPSGAAIAHSQPLWLATMWWRELGAETARALMAAANEPTPTVIRLNPLRRPPAETIAALEGEGATVRPVAGEVPIATAAAVAIEGAFDLAGSAAFAAGGVTPQSLGSMLAVELLDPQPGERVLDLCAAPGTKTTQIAAAMLNQGEVVAVDRDPGRCRELEAMCERMGVSCVRAVEADAGSADLGSGYDRILVDSPCSDLGTLASRPDARWRKSPKLIESLAGEQRRILAAAVPALRPGGTLVYSTCTVSRRENEDQFAELLAAGADGGSLPSLEADDLGTRSPGLASAADGRCLQLLQHRHGTDGFFVARARRTG